MFVFLLFGLFRCYFFCCLGRGVFFCCLGGVRAPPKQQKKNAPPLPSMLVFLLFGRVGVSFFLLFGRGACFFFLLFGPGACVFFVFAVWAGGVVVFFCCLGRGRVIVFAVWAGGRAFFLLFGRGTGVHSLTGLPGLSSSDPTTKKDQTAKKNTGSMR